MNDIEWPMLLYYVIYYEKFTQIMQQTEKEALTMITERRLWDYFAWFPKMTAYYNVKHWRAKHQGKRWDMSRHPILIWDCKVLTPTMYVILAHDVSIQHASRTLVLLIMFIGLTCDIIYVVILHTFNQYFADIAFPWELFSWILVFLMRVVFIPIFPFGVNALLYCSLYFFLIIFFSEMFIQSRLCLIQVNLDWIFFSIINSFQLWSTDLCLTHFYFSQSAIFDVVLFVSYYNWAYIAVNHGDVMVCDTW